jgi:ketosteroid isomerase-like protein
VPEGNIELLLAGLEAFNSGDVERILTFVDPRFEVTIPRELSAEPDTYRGFEGVRRYFETFAEAMDEIRFHAERVWEAGAGVDSSAEDPAAEDLVVEMRLTALGRQTGIPVEQRVYLVWTVREGKALRVQTYPSLREALARAGMPEDPGAPAYGGA